jgi:hypothetical protein
MDAKWTDAGKVLALKEDIKEIGLNFVGTSEPGTPEEGQGWYNSTSNTIKWYNGAAFKGISQGGLETDYEELSFDTPHGDTGHIFQLTDVSGYFFSAQTAFEAGVDTSWYVRVGGGAGTTGHTTYQSFVAMSQHNSLSEDRFCYVKARYVTSSGNIGWLFVLARKDSSRFLAANFSFDHPCWGKGGDPDKFSHPFQRDYDPEKHVIYCITMTREEHFKIENGNQEKGFLQQINEDYSINIDKKTAWPMDEIPVKLNDDRSYIKKKIEKPECIIMASLKEKSS